MTRQDSDQTLNPDLAAAEARCASSRKHIINQPRATVWVWERSPIQGRTTCVRRLSGATIAQARDLESRPLHVGNLMVVWKYAKNPLTN